jgi:hypothetical protein
MLGICTSFCILHQCISTSCMHIEFLNSIILPEGGSKKDGCGRVLTRDKYLDHDNEPYCSACYSKLFRPKGFGFGNTLSTDYGPDVSNNVPEKSTEEAIRTTIQEKPLQPDRVESFSAATIHLSMFDSSII